MQARTHNGKAFRVLLIIDEFTRKRLTLFVSFTIRAEQVMHALADLFMKNGTPDNIRSGNGPECIATALKNWLADLSANAVHLTRKSLGERLL